MSDRLLTVDEAAAILGLQRSTVYTRAERRIRTVKIGRALRIRICPYLTFASSLVRPITVSAHDQEAFSRGRGRHPTVATVIPCPRRLALSTAALAGSRGHR